MATETRTLDYWREYFRGADSGIFDAIENAILIAALDCPIEFRQRRDRIAELLFSCRSTKCLSCDRVEAQAAQTMASNCGYDEAEALTEEMEEEGQIVGEVLRIKEVLSNRKDQSDAVLFESLRRLQLMRLSVETLQTTEVGKAVNGLRRHRSKQIACLAQTLVDEWKALVHDWVTAAAMLAEETTPESAEPASFEIDDGLPFPPLDDGIFLATQTGSIELSKFFDGMDDDGNPRNIGELDEIDGKEKTLENYYDKSRKPFGYSPELSDYEEPPRKHEAMRRQHEATDKHSKSQKVEKRHTGPQCASDRTMKKNGSLQMQQKSNEGTTNSGPGRNPKLNSNHIQGDTKPQVWSRTDVHKKPTTASENKYSEEDLNYAKLEIAKRKLHEGYQQAQNAKKQQTIQVMELTDLPKQPAIHKPPHSKPGKHSKNWANGRR